MAGKYSRKTVGSVFKSKEVGDADYIKLRGDTGEDLAKALLNMDRTKGLNLRLESKKFQLESLDTAVVEGKLKEEMAEKIRERINKIPDYVRFEIVLLTKN